ncbi:Epoxide Hydratase [Hyphodiscus hymeniophilus]|uniref:Epoxide Hydratase n=1 Tax=Hyphodiscus hymeniophilus TaxID=353542 RepID=A0A9P7AVW9_9HELO|nr:Epoxide Hydratase [Hyphodiscus hymeniophilus]
MKSFETNDGVTIKYIDTASTDPGAVKKDTLILIHGFTGSSAVWQRNIPALSSKYHLIAPDLRGHGSSSKPKHGFHVSRLAMDLHELILHLGSQSDTKFKSLKALGGSLGCSILWCYAELFSTSSFTHMIFVDQSPLQNSTLDGWDSRFCNRGMNSAPAVAALQTTLAFSPETTHKGTIAACLSYRSHPLPTDNVSAEMLQSDEAFFLSEAMKGNPEWYGKLMADHTALDWREIVKVKVMPYPVFRDYPECPPSTQSGYGPNDATPQQIYLSGRSRSTDASGTPCVFTNSYARPKWLYPNLDSNEYHFHMEKYLKTDFDGRTPRQVFFDPKIDWLVFPYEADFVRFAGAPGSNHAVHLISLGSKLDAASRVLLAKHLSSFPNLKEVQIQHIDGSDDVRVAADMMAEVISKSLMEQYWAEETQDRRGTSLHDFTVERQPTMPRITIITREPEDVAGEIAKDFGVHRR